MIKQADAPHFDTHGLRFTGLAAPSRGATETAVWRVEVPPHSPKGTAHQLSREEVLVALAGTAQALIGDTIHSFSAGDAIVIPAYTDFSLENRGDLPFEAVAVLPVGGRAILPDTAPFIPPWAQ